MRSNEPVVNGRLQASPLTAAACGSSGSSPCSAMAPISAVTEGSSSKA